MLTLYLFVIWYLFWLIYNFVLLPNNLSTEKTPQPLTLIYVFLSVSLLTLTNIYSRILNLHQILFSLMMLLLLGTLIKNKYLGRLSNSAFQISWLYCFSVLNFSVTALILIFWIGHFPVVFVRHLNNSGKAILLALSLCGGMILAPELTQIFYPLNLLLAVSTHVAFYWLIRPFDAKYKWGIVN